tara:strand:+ start:5082 stop:6338 length:1257 start_codon:yes stop_codon:yes gene_type:complete
MLSNNSYKLVNNCRLCGSNKLDEFISFGKLPLGNNLQKKYSDSINVEEYSLQVNQCLNCSHFQLGHSINPKNLYATNYTYLSSVGSSFVNHMKKYASYIYKKYKLNQNSLVIDIGSNDGLGLKFFKGLGTKVVGIDPAKYASDIANKNGITTINSFFTSEVVDKIISKYGKADFITSHNVLAHVDNLSNVLESIHKLLKDLGIFVFEIGYFKDVLENFYFDTIYHEHLDYHHAYPLVKKLTSLGFEVLNISTNSVQGGSLRIETRKNNKSDISYQTRSFLQAELNSVLYRKEYLDSWKDNIANNMRKLNEKINQFKKSGNKIFGYGAPTKATLLLSLSNLSKEEIPFVFEDNILKIGRFLPGTGISIISTNQIEIIKPSVIVIFAWNFSENIINKIRKKIDWDLKCIVPLPSYHEINL